MKNLFFLIGFLLCTSGFAQGTSDSFINIIKNGDFSNEITGWTTVYINPGSGTEPTVENGVTGILELLKKENIKSTFDISTFRMPM